MRGWVDVITQHGVGDEGSQRRRDGARESLLIKVSSPRMFYTELGEISDRASKHQVELSVVVVAQKLNRTSGVRGRSREGVFRQGCTKSQGAQGKRISTSSNTHTQETHIRAHIRAHIHTHTHTSLLMDR